MNDKYFAVFTISWQQGLAYRLNFILWRVRSVLQLLLVYFIWWSVFQSQTTIFGYTQASILTYILVTALIRAIVLSSRTMDVSSQINEGSIVNFLLKPLDFIQYYFSRDLADKLLNISFVIVEIAILIFLLKPPVIFQTDPVILLLFALAGVLGILLYFCLTFTIGLLAFWVENSWGPMFLIMIFLEGLGGGLFPLDILPREMFNIIMLTPFPYLVYFPAKVYLGTLTFQQTFSGFVVLLVWVILMWLLMKKTLQLGLKNYTAVGH